MATQNDELPESVHSASMIAYRSAGLGLYGAVIRYLGMPLEKIALYMNSSQVSGDNQLRQAIRLTFQNGKMGGRSSFLTPYKVVGPASGIVRVVLTVLCDGHDLPGGGQSYEPNDGIAPMPYGPQLMEEVKNEEASQEESVDLLITLKSCSKIILVPAIAGMVESAVANRAEVQRYYGIQKFSQMEAALNWNPISRLCGPAFLANSSRNFIMSSTSFVITPILYRKYYPQQEKSQASLFWFGLGVNIFVGNAVAITQQALWGRALDYAASGDSIARNIHYKSVIQQGFAKDGRRAFFTVPKWASRVLMNAPVQGTLPWFYNEVLPLGEETVLCTVNKVYSGVVKPSLKKGGGSYSAPSVANAADLNAKIATSPTSE
eukprot:CAMPEP_0176496044 /NCGR_PEP_ID=MMETSP0200_2-20121128/10989_1 /TAXON_ID=947934 /ORGANISM="Chaetoceros sp., Strain GSL56" /LENGTH=375 /DNA_ID=CAMNT_0017893981 /DNA_START=201 /DNA_END=1329 /DNA_ORIENTATION=-